MTDDKLTAIEVRHMARTPGPYRWFGDQAYRDIYLATIGRGRTYVMRFTRWGMQSAQPRFQVTCSDGLGIMVPASELAITEPYRPHEILAIDHPDAIAIERSWEDMDYLLAEAKRLRARGRVLVGIAKERDQQRCPPGTGNFDCPPELRCPACWDAWYNATDEEWAAIVKGGEAE